ncbi:helix-turn-helix transcriptional regulator [Streptomyces sp. DSM 41982]|uniref:Helix-turn-helix transcriptional regulator n=1 Tax=Streptomyces evansiae TaxID=3075535 RepID=A0ABD5EAN7_9ACTN|nr:MULTISPECIES: helix-turn-helix transcriptional regulator [unclassified Streptomyces]MDT0418257.1 helix-turn-helix transcriptional regulator [Streptomyces sp. DSM 41982]SCD29693.1 Helix-turn-helix domain-containing protein [Streptomyces sp. SolWspMP-sol7th]
MEARPNVHRRRFGSMMRSLRQQAGLTMEAAANQLGLPGKPALSKIENGKQRVTGLGLTAFFSVYGVDSEDVRTKVRAMATQGASGKRTNLLDEYREAIRSPGFEDYLHLEELASRAESYLHVVPGLLQTREYATAIVDGSRKWHSRHEVQRFVDLRLARQAVLTRENPIQLRCVLDESALRRDVGGAEVMKGQLQRLLDVTEESAHVSIQILPFGAGPHAGIDGAFQLLHFEVGAPVCIVEMLTTSVYLEEDADVSRYTTALEHLRAQALDEKATRRFIHQLIKDPTHEQEG